MDNNTEKIVSKLKDYKKQNLSYYEATQKLLKLGYIQPQIDDAEDTFNNDETKNLNDNLNEISTKSDKPSMFTQNYSNTGEMYQSKYSRPALLILIAIVTAGIIVALLTGL